MEKAIEEKKRLIRNLPGCGASTVATFAVDTGSSNEDSTGKIQTAVYQIQKWTKKWHIQLN
jgi:hypothetical protein